MTNRILNAFALGLMSVAFVAAPVAAQDLATTNTPAPAAKPAKTKKAHESKFKGKLDKLDDVNKTITVGDETIQITSDTRIFNNGKPAIMGDGTMGEAVHGTYKKSDDGKLLATSVHYGTKDTASDTPKPKKKKAKKETTTPAATDTNAIPAMMPATPATPPIEAAPATNNVTPPGTTN